MKCWFFILSVLLLGFHLSTIKQPPVITDEIETAQYSQHFTYTQPHQPVYAYGAQPFWFEVLHATNAGIYGGRVISIVCGVLALMILATMWSGEAGVWALSLFAFGGLWFFQVWTHTSRPESWILLLAICQIACPVIWWGFIAGLACGLHPAALPVMGIGYWLLDRQHFPRYALYCAAGMFIVYECVNWHDFMQFMDYNLNVYKDIGSPIIAHWREPLRMIRWAWADGCVSVMRPFKGAEFLFKTAIVGGIVQAFRNYRTLSELAKFSLWYGLILWTGFIFLNPHPTSIYGIYALPFLWIPLVESIRATL